MQKPLFPVLRRLGVEAVYWEEKVNDHHNQPDLIVEYRDPIHYTKTCYRFVILSKVDWSIESVRFNIASVITRDIRRSLVCMANDTNTPTSILMFIEVLKQEYINVQDGQNGLLDIQSRIECRLLSYSHKTETSLVIREWKFGAVCIPLPISQEEGMAVYRDNRFYYEKDGIAKQMPEAIDHYPGIYRPFAKVIRAGVLNGGIGLKRFYTKYNKIYQSLKQEQSK